MTQNSEGKDNGSFFNLLKLPFDRRAETLSASFQSYDTERNNAHLQYISNTSPIHLQYISNTSPILTIGDVMELK
jgi:hypothetical protein